jgi:hypothetical protein
MIFDVICFFELCKLRLQEEYQQLLEQQSKTMDEALNKIKVSFEKQNELLSVDEVSMNQFVFCSSFLFDWLKASLVLVLHHLASIGEWFSNSVWSVEYIIENALVCFVVVDVNNALQVMLLCCCCCCCCCCCSDKRLVVL